MSKQTEKMFKELDKFMSDKTFDSEDDLKIALSQFMPQYQASAVEDITKQNAETSDDFLELAESAPTKKKALDYAKKSLELDPDNLDAEVFIAELSATSNEKLLDKYKKLVDKATRKMTRQGYFSEDAVGKFWLILETRPYMRLRANYLDILIKSMKIHLAIYECEEMLRLCEGDNLGVRYRLMHLYVYLEDEKSALGLLERYPEEGTQFLLPLSMLYYKLGDLKEAAKYLKALEEVNKDTLKFFNGIVNGRLEKFIEGRGPYGYQPFTIEEFIEEIKTNSYLLVPMIAYFDWAQRKLKSMK